MAPVSDNLFASPDQDRLQPPDAPDHKGKQPAQDRTQQSGTSFVMDMSA